MGRFVLALLLAGCATPPSTPAEVSPTVATAEWDRRLPALRECYRSYVMSFGGTSGDGELRSSERGATVAGPAPFRGEVEFVVEIEVADSEVRATAEPSPDPVLTACWLEALEAEPWPVGAPTVVTRTVEFEIVEPPKL